MLFRSSPGVNPGTWTKAAGISSSPTEGEAPTSEPDEASDASTDTNQSAAPEVEPEKVSGYEVGGQVQPG